MLLHPGHLVVEAPGASPDFGGGTHEEAAPWEDPPLDVGEVAVAERQQAIAARLCLGERRANDFADKLSRAALTVASCSSSFDPKRAWTLLLGTPVISASRPMVRPSSPSTVAS